MSLGASAYKVGGAGECSSMRRRYPWQPFERPPPGTVTLNNSVEYLLTIAHTSIACSYTVYFLFEVLRARVIKYKPQGIYWPPAQGGGFSRSVLALARSLRSPMFSKKNEKKNKTRSVYRLIPQEEGRDEKKPKHKMARKQQAIATTLCEELQASNCVYKSRGAPARGIGPPLV